ncbi:MAG TPA: DUF881 domain-containing protein [Nocardioidaceae bacterium]|nr:DUF881 domain-containing protein [Nocardioidaceae bacterium]
MGTAPPQASLLDYITAHSLDEDYAHVAQQRALRGDSERGRPGRGAMAALALFGAIVAVAGVQTARTAGVEAQSHDNLVAQINSGKDVLDSSRERLALLESELARARSDNLEINVAEGREQANERRLGTVAGGLAVRGPGLRVVVDDAVGADEDAEYVLDKDIRNIVNGLWASGAEAIAVNGQRLTPLSAIDFAGSHITVDYETLAAPYTVLAIGDPNRMPSRFVESTTGTAWLNAQQTFGLRFQMDVDESITIPGVSPARLALRVATGGEVEGAQ